MKLSLLLLTVGLLKVSCQHGYFFPEAELRLSKGTLRVPGVLAETNHEPLFVKVLESNDEQPKASNDAEARGLSSKGNVAANLGKLLVLPPLPPELSPIRLTDSVTVTRVTPPICVACKCLQTAPSCSEVNGYVLVTQSLTLGGGADPIPAGAIATLVAPNALSCVGSTAGNLPVPVANLPDINAGTTVTLTCLVPPPPTMSSCDTNCRTTTGVEALLCVTAPSQGTCPQVATPAACNSPCQNVGVGSVVKCNQAFPAVVSPRPTSVCLNLRKREVVTSPRAPAVDSSLEAETSDRRGHLLGFGINVARTTTTRTNVISGAVTATYVGDNCLPSNILVAPNC